MCVDVYPKHSALFLVNFRCHNCEKRHKAAAQRPTANSLLNCECDEIAWLPRTAHTNTLSSKCHSVCAIRRDNSSVPFIFVWMHSNAMWINESQINCENARMLLQKRRVLEMLFKRDQIDVCVRWTTYGLLANGRPPFSVHTFYENANSHFFSLSIEFIICSHLLFALNVSSQMAFDYYSIDLVTAVGNRKRPETSSD